MMSHLLDLILDVSSIADIKKPHLYNTQCVHHRNNQYQRMWILLYQVNVTLEL